MNLYQSSREMVKRNTIFKNIASNLEENLAMEKVEARALAKQALVENRKGSVHK